MGSREIYDSVIVRFGPEIGVKSGPVRLRYERLIVKHVREVLRRKGIPFSSLIHDFGRLYVLSPQAEEAARVISRVFGVSSTSPALRTSSEMEDILATGLLLARSVLREGMSFAVRCRRVGEHPYTSMDVCRLLGSRILEELGHLGLKVDLEEPDKEIHVEVRGAEAYVFTDLHEGVGGYPLGVQGKVICLLSSGIDSPVACWLSMRRGCLPVLVHFDIRPYTDDRALSKALELAAILADWAMGRMKHIYVVPHGPSLEEIKKKCPEKLTCVLCKRLMYRIAERLAGEERAEAIITGDAIGEQASQTLRNLRAIDAAVEIPVLRPLLCFDKDETIELARRIGTYEVSARPDLGCRAAPRKPTTAAKADDVVRAEEALDLEALIGEALRGAEKIRLKG